MPRRSHRRFRSERATASRWASTAGWRGSTASTPSKAPRASATSPRARCASPCRRRDATMRGRSASAVPRGSARKAVRVSSGLSMPSSRRIAARRSRTSAALPGRAAGSRARQDTMTRASGLTQRRIHGTWIGEVAGDQPVQGGAGVGGLEREPSGAEPVEDRAQGEDVGALVGLPAVDDLGRHVVRRPDHGAGHGHAVVLGEDPGDAEVGQLHRGSPAELGDHDVLGLQVPVDDAGRVGVDQRVRQRDADDRPALRERDPLLVGEGAEGPAVDELGDEPALGGPVPRVVVDLHDPRMGQARHGPGFPGEPGARVGLRGEVGVEHLDRDLAVERGVAAPVDDRHSTGSHLLEELVTVDPANQSTPSGPRRRSPSDRRAL